MIGTKSLKMASSYFRSSMNPIIPRVTAFTVFSENPNTVPMEVSTPFQDLTARTSHTSPSQGNHPVRRDYRVEDVSRWQGNEPTQV